MKRSKSTLILKTWNRYHFSLLSAILLVFTLFLPGEGFGRIFIDINAPSIQKIKIAIPDFKNFSDSGKNPELTWALTKVISYDLDLSGYFIPMDKKAFIDEDGPLLTSDNIHFKNWSIIGAELLLKGGYTCIGGYLDVTVRLYDAYYGSQIMAKRYLGKTEDYRRLMHRIGNEIVFAITGYHGLFLTRFAFVNDSTGHKEIFLCDFDGGNVQQLTYDDSIAMLPRWSPTGEQIVFNSYKDGSPMLYLYDMSSGNVRRVSERTGLNIGACWSSDGKNLGLTLSHQGSPDIYSIDLSGKIMERYTTHWAIDVSPSFSPDGAKMAFVSNRSGNPQIYVKDLHTGSEERLTFDLKYCTSPSWSKLNKISFTCMNDGHFDIYTIDPDGSNLTRLTYNNRDNEDPCWSPDGRYIVFTSNRDGGYHLYIMNSNGKNQNRITFLKGEDTSPSWSPF
jgi:TolB protein